jgi:hypothetical protein
LSISLQLDAETEPALLVVAPAAASLDEAHAAIELWEHYSRKRLDPAQRLSVEVMMAQAADGRWAASTTGREMPRQNGKGDEIEVVELWGLVQRSEAILHTVHDAVLLASQAQQRMLGVLEGHADVRRLVKRKWLGTGQQMIEMRNGGVIWYRTRTNGGGRGVDDVDRLVIDEAQHASEEHLAAVSPTLLANSNPQMNAMGTAGLAGKSDWWWTVRLRALSPDPGAFGYVGHTAETVYVDGSGRVVQDPVDVQDRALWRRANPAVVAGRGQGMAFLEEQLRRLGPVAFAREHLGVWDPAPGEYGSTVIPLDKWLACSDAGSSPVGMPVFAFDVTPDEAFCSIAAAGRRADGLPHAEVVDHRAGTSWAALRLLEIKQKWGQVRIVADLSGPAGGVAVEAKALGVEVEAVPTQQYMGSCANLLNLATETRFRHRTEPVLDEALRGAVKKDVGDGAWKWSRNNSTVVISPLVAVTLALGAVEAVPAAVGFKSLDDYLDD